MKRKLSYAALVLILTLLGTLTGFGTTRTTTASGGNWNATTTWSGGVVPASGDAAVIVAGASVTVTANATVNSIVFNNASANMSVLTVNPGIALTVSAGITNQNAATTNTSVSIQGTGMINCAALAIGGSTTPTPSGSYFTATVTSTISNLTISSNLTVSALYNSTQSAANVGTLALGSGLVSVGGSVSFVTVPLFGPILTMATGSQNGTLKLSGSTPFSVSGGGSSIFNPSGTNATVIYAGAAQTVNAATYQDLSTFVGYQNLALAGSGTKTTTGVTVNGILLMQGTAVASGAPTYGTNASLEYNGNAAQITGPELTTALPNLTINNASGVTLAGNPTISNMLTLTNGILITGAKQLTLATNASVSGGSVTSYVNGNLQKTFSPGTQAFTFPIGDSSSYAPLALSGLVVTTSGSIKATTTGGNHPQIATSGIDASEDVNRYWTLTRSGGIFGNYNTTFNYPASDVDIGANASQFVVSQWSGGAWSAETVSGTPTTTSTSISGQSGFGDFVIGDPAVAAAGTLIWTGDSVRDINWSTMLNWTNVTAGGVGPPGTNNDVLFTNLDTVTASALTSPGSGVVIPTNINSYVDANISIGSLTNLANALSTSPNFQNIGIASGATLTVNSNLQVGGYNEYDFGSNNVANLTISGSGAALQLNLGSLLVVESSTNRGAHNAVLDLSGLDLFTLNGLQLKLGAESSPAGSKYASGILYLAKTNIITIYSAGYTNTGVDGVSPYSGNPGLYIGHNVSFFGSGSQVYLGITNGIYVDYATIGRGDTNALMAFNPAFLGMNPSVYLRGTNGGSTRVGVYVVGDGSAGTEANNAPSTNDFSGGTVDAMIDYFCIGRGRQANATISSAVTNGGSGVFTFNRGTINANTLIAGYMYASGSNSPAIGTVNVNGSGTLVVNNSLTLAQAANVVGQTVFPQGTLNINGGTVMASTITSGGGTNMVTMTNGTLIVTNTMGTSASPITTFALTNSTIQLSVTNGMTNMVVSALKTGGAQNQVNIALLPVTISTPKQFTLIDYSGTIGGAGYNFVLGTLPPKIAGYLSNNIVKSSVDLVITNTNAIPTQLVITSVNGGTSPTAGAAFSMVVQAQDAGNIPRNVISNTVVSLSLHTGGGILGGTLTGTITAGNNSVTISGVTYTKAESGIVLTATRTSGDILTAANSSSFTVNAGAFAQLQLLMPGETASPGSVSGKTGTPNAQAVGTAFNLTVNAVDANWNLINTNDTVTITSSDGSAVLPGNAALSGGTQTFSLTFKTAGSQTVTASDVTHVGITANTSPSTTVNHGNQTITFPSPGNQTYGVGPIALGATASSGLTVSYNVTSGPASVTGNSLTITGAVSVTIQASQTGDANWNAATPVNQTISVAQKSVIGSITVNDKVYDGTTNATIASRTLTGVTNSDVASLTGGSAAFTNKNVGNNRTVIVTSLGLTGANAGNYVLFSTSATNSANITQATLTVSGLIANDKVYDATTNATLNVAGASLVGVFSGDSVTLNTGAAIASFADKIVATDKAVTVSGLTIGGADAANYLLTQPTATASITVRSLAVSARGVDKVYDGTTNATVSLSDNRVAGDMLTTSYTTAAFADKNVGNGKTVSVSGISVTGIDLSNYVFNTTTNTTANIMAATLTASADDKSRAFGTTNPLLTASYNGFISGEGVGVLSGSPALSTAATTNSPVGVYPIMIAQGTLSATNYVFDFTNGILTIVEVPPLLSISLESNTNGPTIYCDGLTPSNTYYILASTNLIFWTQIYTQQAFPDGTFTFTDTNTIPNRFYRLSGN